MQFRKKISNTKVFIECYLKFRSSLHLSFFGGHLPVMMLKHDDVLPFSAFQCLAQQSFGSQTQPFAWVSKKWYSRGSSTFVRSLFLFHLFSLFFRKNELPFMFRYFLLSFFVAFSSHMNELFSFQKYKFFTKKKTKLLVHSRQRAQKIGFTAMLAKITANFSRRFCESTRIQIFFFAYTI